MADNDQTSRLQPMVNENSQELVPLPNGFPMLQPRRARQPRGEAQQGLNLSFILNAMRRWWVWATPAAVILTTAGIAIVWILFEKKYEAEAWLRMEERTPFLAFDEKSTDPQAKSFFQTQIELIRSPMVLGPAVKEVAQVPEIQRRPDPISWLSKQIKVTSVGGSELFRILYSSDSPENAKAVVNAVTESYFRLRDSSETERTQRVIDLLEKEKTNWSGKVVRLRGELREMAKDLTGRETLTPKPDMDAVERRPLADLQGRLISAQVESAVIEAKLQVAEEDMKKQQDAAAKSTDATAQRRSELLSTEKELRDATIAKALDESPEVRRQKDGIRAKESRLGELESRLVNKKNDPVYRQAVEGIARDRQVLERLRNEIRPDIVEQVDAALIARRMELESVAVAKQRDELARLRTERKTRQVMEERLKAEYDKELKNVKRAGGDTLELEFKRDELARAEKVFELIAQRTLALQTEQRAPARVNLLRLAETPSVPVEAFPWKMMALVGPLCLCLPFALAVGWERLIRRINGSEDLEKVMHLTVLGEIARLPTRVPLKGTRVPATPGLDMKVFQESVDSLRTQLTLCEELRDMRLLAITSASNDEGKTSVASQLAISLARATGECVLLIDGDMRSPDIHRTFGIPLVPGLAKVLQHECSIEEAIVTTWSQHVHLLPAGKLSGSPHRVLGNGAWKTVLAQVPAKYRYVVIDTPPVLAASEALVLAKAADASLICAMRDVSRMDQVKLVHDRLVSVGGNPAGIVLNGVPTKHYAYRYGTYS